VDLEHGAGSEDALLGQLHAAAAHDVPVIVRVETAERIRIGRVLDLGAAGVMYPRLDTAQEVVEATSHAFLPPRGDRGVATYNRACQFGLDVSTLDTANDEVINVVQVETLSALEHIEEIARVDGVHALFVGPRDLSHALGIPGQIQAPEFRQAMHKVLAAADAAGIAAGILAGNEKLAVEHAEQGFTFIGIASDSTFLANAAQAAARTISEAGVTSEQRAHDGKVKTPVT